MNIRRLASLLCGLSLTLSLVFVPGHARAADDGMVAVPAKAARVTDNAAMLTPQQRGALEQVLADYETRSGSQIAVLLIPSTAPESIEQYSIRVGDAWKLGRKGVDDGVLLLVAKDNPAALRRLRIEAGRGVQGTLTDAQSKRVLQDVIAPHFKRNDYYGGLVAGVGAIQALLNQEQLPAPAAARQPAAQQEQQQQQGFGLLLPLLFLGFMVVMALLRSRGGGRRLQRGSWGSGASGVLLGSALSQGWGSGGGSGGGGGFGGGGFSGGGGSFDGGGASGDW